MLFSSDVQRYFVIEIMQIKAENGKGKDIIFDLLQRKADLIDKIVL